MCRPKTSLAETFWRHVVKNDDGCWGWNASLDEHGYAVMRHRDFKSRKASRISYFLHFGEFDFSLNVLHTCDNPECTRFDHLYLGTQKQNGEDMQRRKRSPWGENNGSVKLTALQVAEILKSLERNRGVWGIQTRLAKQYGVTQGHICRINSGELWNQLEGVENAA